ncbi:MAG: ATP-binding protein [Anaerolineales bacterium]
MTLSGISELPLFKRRSSGAEELEALLDLLPHPTLIADRRSGRVLFANAQATQLTAYTRRELSELDLPSLLPDFGTPDLNDGESKKPKPQKLIARSSRSTTVTVKVDELGGPDHWLALSLQPPTEPQQDPQTLDQQRWEAMHMLSLAAQQKDLAACYRQILQAGSLLTGAAHGLLYLPDQSGGLSLKAVVGEGLDFPASLPASDLGHLRTPKIWQSGKPLESALHKMAHAAKLTYLATAPLDITNPADGLVAAASEGNAPPKPILTMLQILGASAATETLKANVNSAMTEELTRLKENEAIRGALLEQSQDGVLFTDQQIKVIEINPAAEGMLGYSTAEVRGRPANDVLISSQPLLPILERAANQGKVIEVGERKLHRRDGSEFLAFVRIAPLSTPGSVSKLAILFTDLSEHEAFHLQSQQLQNRAWLGEITAYFAHEVRNPINNLSTGLQLMQISLPEQDPMQDQIRRLQEDCDRLDHRMKSVLNLSRNLEHHPEPMDLGEFCRIQLERWRPRMARKNIKDHLQVAPFTPLISGDRKSLDQVFTNLITNAIHALQDQQDGIIAIKVQPDPENSSYVDVHVSDNGPGIPEELRQRVFEPFFTTKNEEGTGLGLAISKRIILMHNGDIKLESFPGGTLFRIKLPAAPATEGNVVE